MKREEVLDEAMRIVSGDRENTYGGPEDSFNRIAALWNAYLQERGGHLAPLSPVDVAIMMALLKIARLSAAPTHKDSWVDLAGYAACGGEIASCNEMSEEYVEQVDAAIYLNNE